MSDGRKTNGPDPLEAARQAANLGVRVHTVGFGSDSGGEAPAEPVDGVPAGWKIDLLGGGQPVASAMPAANESVSLQLRVDVPKDAKPGSQNIMIKAKGLLVALELPVTLTIANETPAKLTIKTKLPSLMGTPKSTFDYTLSVSNDSGKDLTVALAAQAPANFQTSFTEGFGSNEISQLPIEAGQSKDIKIKVTPPRDVKAGNYPVTVRVSAEEIGRAHV